MEEKIDDIQVGDRGDEKLWATLSYIPPLFIITLILMKDKKYVFIHSKQSLVLFVLIFVLSFMNIVPFLGWIAFAFVGFLSFILWIVAVIYALTGKERVPLLANLADKLPL
jgi:uncharacterized membrane protein